MAESAGPCTCNRDSLHLKQADFKPLLLALLGTHPGLEFLKDAPEFQERRASRNTLLESFPLTSLGGECGGIGRYVETVIYRIFYSVNRSSTGSISLRELKRSCLLEAMFAVDEEEDINKVLKFFSYEHFYVIYCKFWELDTDRAPRLVLCT